ncbi:MAG: hypothetical protein JO134_04925 [Xanthobacteraceae bacterium]|nr:hypothetical protein [Xanthobacteraceae bacterium]
MSLFTIASRELIGLFVDDGWLAAAILGVVAVAAITASLIPGGTLAAGAILLCGLLTVLLVNTVTAARR